jgi:Protein of unknown function (DUF993)
MFDPALEGYWGSRSVDVAMETCLSLITTYAASIEGIKISLLNASYEEAMRAPLPSSVVSSPVMISTTQTLLRKTGGIIRTRCLAYSTRSRPLLRRLSRGWALATARATTLLCHRRCRCRGGSLRRRPNTTRRVWCSSPGSMVSKIISQWSARCSQLARFCIMPTFSGLPMTLVSCEIPISRFLA